MAFKFVDEYPANTATGAGGGGGCFTCGASKRPDDILIELGVETDRVVGLDGEFYGAKIPVICGPCAIELGALAGCLSPGENRHLRGELAIALAQNDQMSDDLRNMKALRDAIQKVKV